MDFGNYKYANIKNDSEFRERLTRFEAEIAQDFGENVVLIAYSKNQNSENPNS